ncbi:tyrosine--tRNA ligase [candidate division WOR-3 bacterium]|nr:tyrosine--tRNA ligase [candidate division WOR-3 bacterium]
MDELVALKRGAADIIPIEEFEERIKKGEKLRVKLGIDPTAPDIHLGFSVPLRKMRQFQDFGHTAVLVVGDFTAMIGDPSGRSKTRPPLTEEEVKKNMEQYKEQILKILKEDNLEFRYNSEWLGRLTSKDIIKLAAKTTVARILERDDFEKRMKENVPISLHEILYPLFQAYDSVAIRADVELGGTDQRFNHLLGRDLQREFGQRPQVVFLLPLLEGLDGKLKMSKSYGNYVGINEPPDQMFGKIMSIPDALIMKYFILCTDLDNEELEKIERSLKDKDVNPRDIKLDLAETIVRMYHSETAAKKTRENFIKVFSKRELPEDMEEVVYPEGERVWIVKVIRSITGLSSSDIRRVIKQGGLKIDGEKVTDTDLEITVDREYVIKFGKKTFFRVRPE